ncbi:MAG: PAS domain S-box protein, partial [Desulfovibrionales bacterium]|nr:PAS domain S-box protein [Desulfovibrionales bacterium]
MVLSRNRSGVGFTYEGGFFALLSSFFQGKTHRIKQLEEQVAGYVRFMDAAPDPIVHYDTQGRVAHVNPAFTRVFGWELDHCRHRKMDHFVPRDHWEETRMMIAEVVAGRDIHGVETRRYNRGGEILEVSISGASIKDSRGRFAGSIIVLRDITRSRELEKSLIHAGEREQHRIGRDLHDDLCPHLLGMAGLTAAIGEDASRGRPLDPSLTTTLLNLT